MLLLSFLVASLGASAQALQSVLWEISGNGLKDKSYLFGTVHTASPSLLSKFPVKHYMSKTQFGVFELTGNPISPAPPTTKSSVPPRPQPPLDSLFSDKDYAVVDSFFSASPLGSIKAHNADADLGGMLWAVATLKGDPTAAPVGLDNAIAEEMQHTGKPLFCLDTNDDPDRKKLLETNYVQLASAIVSLIKEKATMYERSLPEGIGTTYVTQLAVNLKLREEAAGLVKEVTVRRNLLWYPQLAKQMQVGACFIAVGLGHLQYKSGLIKLLQQHGYKVEPVKLPSF